MDTNIENSTTLLLCRQSNVKGEIFKRTPTALGIREKSEFYKPCVDVVDVCNIIKQLKSSPVLSKK